MADGMTNPIGPDVYAAIISGLEAENARNEQEEEQTFMGPVRPDEAAEVATADPEKAGEKFTKAANTQKDDYGYSPGGQIKTSAERVQDIIKEHEEGVARREYKDNVTKYLTMLAGTALMMAGAHNKNPGMFAAGGIMNKVAGFQLKNWYRSQNQALDKKVDPLLVAARRSGTSVKDAMDVLQERANILMRQLTLQEFEEAVGNWPNMTPQEKAYLKDQLPNIKPSPESAALKDYQSAGESALKEGIVSGEDDLPWPRGPDAVKAEILRRLQKRWDTADQNDPIRTVSRDELPRIAEEFVVNPPRIADLEVAGKSAERQQ